MRTILPKWQSNVATAHTCASLRPLARKHWTRSVITAFAPAGPSLGPPPVIPTGTDIPTLVLGGQFDPNASLPLSRHVAELIGSHARWVEFPLIGHSIRHRSPCATAIVAAFIDRPEQALDTSCTRRTKPIQFLSP